VPPVYAADRQAASHAAAASAPATELSDAGHLSADAPNTWLPIRRAAALLGISPATLRLWTAAGKVRAVMTPGGHRRYAEADLRPLLGSAAEASWESTASEIVESLRERYAQLARGEVQRQAWFGRFDAAARTRAHGLGESLLTLVARLLAAPGARERASLLPAARRIGGQYGREVARLGLTASDGLEAFLFFRTPILDSVNATVRARPGLALPAGAALAAVTDLMDEVLLALTRSYERSRVSVRGAERRAPAARRPRGVAVPPASARTDQPSAIGSATSGSERPS
jgi:excisionase family DNA binding protein